MITPNKSIPLKDSILYKYIYILEKDFESIYLVDLYKAIISKFDGIDEFLYSIDVLFLLNLVDVDFELGKISRC
ncbi:ABC-three component system middle component 7 [Acinetobacter variabilis]|uniref:ABC-three component system middle component 7 n=1 Tax=Acinetobacter variabilis TaxID=70346 RepID=UPI0028A720C0|nr:ABC-three component system middle component 7 [Acinetobacter variabilis]